MIRVLAIGDIMGKAGRRCLQEMLPLCREKFSPDIVIANGENAAGGFGLTEKIFKQLTEKFGIDCITTGNHWHDKPEIKDFGPRCKNLLLPANMFNVPEPDSGLAILKTASGVSYAVLNLYGNAFMHGQNRCPFTTADQLLEKIPDSIKVIIVDMHAEVTSEKQALAQYLTSRISLFYGTHTHCATADERILGKHTGLLTDVGMTGAYDSVIGVKTEHSLKRFLSSERVKFEPAKKDPWLCFVTADIDPTSGACISITRHRWELDKLKAEGLLQN